MRRVFESVLVVAMAIPLTAVAQRRIAPPASIYSMGGSTLGRRRRASTRLRPGRRLGSVARPALWDSDVAKSGISQREGTWKRPTP